MFFAFLLLARSEEEVLGAYDPNTHAFLPPLPKDSLDARGLLIDYPDKRFPFSTEVIRLVSTFKALSSAELDIMTVFGHFYNTDGELVTNYTTYGYPAHISSEESSTQVSIIQWASYMEANTYQMDAFAIVTAADGKNYSALLLNETVEIFEYTNYKETIGSAILYIFVIVVLGGIIYLILSKDQRTTMSTVAQAKTAKKKTVRDYSEIHTSDRSSSPGATKRTTSPARN